MKRKHTKHTKGNWVINITENGICYIDSEDGVTVAEAHSLLDGKNNEALRLERIANAKLIAAAPEMLTALRNILNGHKVGILTGLDDNTREYAKEAEQAIQRATS